jgi:hypothetical protein
MTTRPSFLVFSTVFGVAYTVCFYYNWALFRFYPAYSQFSLGALGPDAGPAILWYGWIALAFVVAAAVALVVPTRVAERISPTVVWGVTAAVLIGIAIYERRWFL